MTCEIQHIKIKREEINMNEAYGENLFIHKTMLWIVSASVAPIALWLFVMGFGGVLAIITNFAKM